MHYVHRLDKAVPIFFVYQLFLAVAFVEFCLRQAYPVFPESYGDRLGKWSGRVYHFQIFLMPFHSVCLVHPWLYARVEFEEVDVVVRTQI